MSTVECQFCPETFAEVAPYVEHREQHRPLPGQLHFAVSATSTYLNTGSGQWLWNISDKHGHLTTVHKLPSETEFIEARVAGSRLGGGTPVVIAYDPELVKVVDNRKD